MSQATILFFFYFVGAYKEGTEGPHERMSRNGNFFPQLCRVGTLPRKMLYINMRRVSFVSTAGTEHAHTADICCVMIWKA